MTPEQIEFHRKKFEEYYAGDIKLERKGNGNYIYMQAHIAWNTWISAIESIEIPLPDQLDSSSAIGISATHECLGHKNCLAEVKHNIQSLGLKAKEW